MRIGDLIDRHHDARPRLASDDLDSQCVEETLMQVACRCWMGVAVRYQHVIYSKLNQFDSSDLYGYNVETKRTSAGARCEIIG